ncbi:MAG TPA: hypothetical protein CFH81_03275 [Sulfurovum sp. UBA12169]|nr:MAG TPA: hypothetical protein CFH81_03275 [Sulfurovum sp. UBA12169]
MTNNEAFKILTEEYTLKLATTQEDFQAVKAVRAEVFAPKYNMSRELLESKGYLFSEDDKQSFLFLLQHTRTGRYVGTARNFFINSDSKILSMPMQKDGHVEGIDHLVNNIPICEISRMALSNQLDSYKDFSELKLRNYLSLGLMITTRINFFLYRYAIIFAIMEPSLHRILKRQGVNFEQIGEPVDYYGMRTPFAIDRKKLLKETEESMGDITRHYLKALCKDPEPFWQFIDANPYLDRSDIRLEKICELFKTHGEDVELSYLLEENEEMAAANA